MLQINTPCYKRKHTYQIPWNAVWLALRLTNWSEVYTISEKENVVWLRNYPNWQGTSLQPLTPVGSLRQPVNFPSWKLCTNTRLANKFIFDGPITNRYVQYCAFYFYFIEVLSRAHAKGEKAFTMISNQIQLALLLPLVSVPQWRPAPGAASMTAKGLNGRYLTDVKFDSLKSNISYTRQKNNEVVCQSVYVL